MDVYAIAFSTLMGGMALVFANASTFASDEVRRERYVRHGVLRAGDAPDSDASAAFIAREKQRERQALLGSAVVTGLAIVGVAVLGAPTGQTMWFVVLWVAFMGRALVMAALAAREARQPTVGPRVSRGELRPLVAWLPVWPWVALGVAQAAFLAAYVPQSLALRPDMVGWVLGLAVASVLGAVLGWGLAWWVARQPQLAADAGELAWSDTVRRRDLIAMLLTGPALAFGVMVSAFSYDGEGSMGDPVGSLPALAFGYLGVFAVLAGVGAFLGRRRAAREVVAGHADR